MSESSIRTVLGDIPAAELGPCDAHEHLFLDTPHQPGQGFTDFDRNLAEAQTLAEAGARAVIDWTPIGLGRDPIGLRELARRARLHVVAATGLHRDAHYRAEDELRTVPVEQLTERFVAEIERGMDDTDIRAGVIKVGASYHHVTGFEAKAQEAGAAAQLVTGAPLCVHTEQGTHGIELVSRLRDRGVAGERIVMAHLDRNPDPGQHAEIAAAGAWLAYDGPGRTKYWPDSTLIGLIGDLAERGLSGQILLGGDVGRAAMLRSYGGGPGLDYVFAKFLPRLRRELGEELTRAIFEINPARAFALAPVGKEAGS